MKPEFQIEAQILAYLRSIGVWCWKNPTSGFFDSKIQRFRKHSSPYAINGVSDILGLLPSGRFLAIEVKSDTGKLSIHQKTFLEQINKNGGVAIMAKSVDEVKRCLIGLIP